MNITKEQVDQTLAAFKGPELERHVQEGAEWLKLLNQGPEATSLAASGVRIILELLDDSKQTTQSISQFMLRTQLAIAATFVKLGYDLAKAEVKAADLSRPGREL
jgi:hypothetical protein